MEQTATNGTSTAPFSFLQGGGQMGALTRAYDWAATPVGDPATWPVSLRTIVCTLLNSRFPMLLYWSGELIQFYNDAFRPSLGINSKHPRALGQRAEECWPEMWDAVGPFIHGVMETGIATWNEDQLLPIYRNGALSDAYWTYSFTPVRGDSEAIEGVLVVCTETTQNVHNLRQLEESKSQLQFAIDATELATWDYNPSTGKFSANERLKDWFGLTPDHDVALTEAIAAIAEGDRQRVSEAIAQALQWESGGGYNIDYSIIHPVTGVERIVCAKGRASFGEDKIAYRFTGTLQDITTSKKVSARIAAAQQQLELTLNNIPAAIYLFEQDGRLSFANKAAMAEMKDSLGGEEPPQRLSELVTGVTQAVDFRHENGQPVDPMRSPSQVALETGKETELVFQRRHRHRDDTRWFINRAIPLLDEAGIVTRVLTINTDITAQQEAAEKIRESELRFQIMADATPNMIWALNPDGTNRYTNQYGLEFFGATEEGVRQMRPEEILHPDEIDTVMQTLMQAMQNLQPYSIEHKMRRHDGVYRCFLVNGAPSFYPNGDLFGYVGSSIDITHVREAESARQQSEEEFRTFSDNLQNLAWIADADGGIFWYNQRWYDYTGTALEEMRGWGWQAVHHPQHVGRVLDFVKDGWLKDEPFELTFPLRGKDGAYRWFLTRAVPVFNKEGKRYRWIGTNTDIHEQVLAQEALRESEARYRMLAATLEQQVSERTAELMRSNEDLQQFAHVASHDLKEPVRKILTFARMLETADASVLSERGRLSLDKVLNASDRMMNMVNGVLAYSKLAAAEQPSERIDLSVLIADVEADLEVSIHQKRAQIACGQLPEVWGAKVLIHQLFYNLISNALKFSKDNVPPRIIITGEAVGNNAVKIVVADNGIGFEPEYAEAIFKTFTRLNTKDNYEGTGLGLSLCRKIVERHGGSIKAEGVEGEGAKFIITLPLHSES